MEQKVLVLNQDFRAISLCSIHKAFILIFLNKAEMIAKVENAFLYSVNCQFPKPSVIRLQRYVHVPYKGISLSRQNIFKRDQFQCQYCGSSRNLTLDHVLPRSRGGTSTWSNLITACSRCNNRKGDRTPEEAGLNLRQKPRRPTLAAFLTLHAGPVDDVWRTYLQVKE
ncbi:MAG: HNH endonuclease [Hymenobacteraceae bacterium]|nr:HNH endonuclease [Hymenobacteraceae bacterium]MDX5395863.1 HNH endonuclease [Hymenobacteraceae bacterium]MDX5511918.1 HNH endonuclease [Hymenobacteraceae bacterium]